MSDSRPSTGAPLSKSHPCHDRVQTLSHHHVAEGVACSFSYPRLRSLSPEKELSSSRSQATLAERRRQCPLTHLAVDYFNTYGDPYLQRAIPIQTMPESHTPKARIPAATDCEWDSESVYSGDDNTAARVSPLRLSSRGNGCAGVDMADNTVFREYYNWKHSSPGNMNAAGHSTPETLLPNSDTSGLKAGKACERKVAQPRRHILYSPLTPFFADNGVPADKKGSKTLFGQNGWLERTGQTPEKKKDPQKKSMFDGLRKVAKDLVSLILVVPVTNTCPCLTQSDRTNSSRF